MSKSYLESLLGEREKIILVVRQHWFILARAIALEVILILAIVATMVFMAVTFALLPPLPLIITIVGFLILLIPIATLTRDILIWTNHQFIITNRRIIQISGVFNKNVTDSSLEKVNDVKMSQSALGRLFNYGDVEILTASELGVNLFKRIVDPVNFKTAMLNAKEKLEHGEDQPEAISDIPGLIEKLANLRAQGALTEEEFEEKKKALLAHM